MEKYYRQTIGSAVVTRSGDILTRIIDIIINTDKGKIVGFVVAAGHRKVIAPIDIVRWDKSIIIHDAYDIVDISDVIHIQNAAEKNIRIYKNKVTTKDGDYIGKVIDFGIDNKFFNLTCLITAKSFMGIFFWDKKIISAKDIIEVKKDKIIVKTLVKPVKMKKLQVDMAST